MEHEASAQNTPSVRSAKLNVVIAEPHAMLGAGPRHRPACLPSACGAPSAPHRPLRTAPLSHVSTLLSFPWPVSGPRPGLDGSVLRQSGTSPVFHVAGASHASAATRQLGADRRVLITFTTACLATMIAAPLRQIEESLLSSLLQDPQRILCGVTAPNLRLPPWHVDSSPNVARRSTPAVLWRTCPS